MVRQVIIAGAFLAAAGCTPGGIASGVGGGGNIPVTGKVVRINVSLTLYSLVQTPAGAALGYSPQITSVNVGDQVVFTNQDSFANTATLIGGSPTTFPSLSPFSVSAITQSGNVLSQPWSSGALTQSGSSSQPIVVDKPGTYLYGCFYHYDGKMRGEIIAQ